jgi:hypothetical protein
VTEAGELEGSTFRRLPTRSFATRSAAEARARNILTDQYDPRLTLDTTPRAIIVGPTGHAETHVMVSSGLALLSTLKADEADERREALRGALGVWNTFELMAGLR